jgi:hypothetical protein
MAENVLGTLFGKIADAIREKTGDNATMKPADFPEQIKNIEASNVIENVEVVVDFSNGDMTQSLTEGYSARSVTIKKPDNLKPEYIAKDVNIAGVIGTHEGGGSAEGTATVTFCDYDGTKLYSRLVFIGDDCPEPVAQNKMDKPIRGSDVQYNYKFSGWSATQGGTASETVLKNITADKTVYAAYTASLVEYTVRFYDGDTLMQESKVAYGETATAPSTTKSGYVFISWAIDGVQTTDLTITENTDIYGVWELCQGYISIGALSYDTTTNVKSRCCFSPDGLYFAVADRSGKIYIFNVSDWSLAKSLSYRSVSDIVFSPDSKYLAIAYYGGISIYSCGTWTSYTSKTHSSVNVDAAAFTSDSTRVYYKVNNNTSDWYIELSSKTASSSLLTRNSYTTIRSGGDTFVFSTFASTAAQFYKWNGTTLKAITLPDDLKRVTSVAINDTGTKVFTYNETDDDCRLYTINEDLTATYKTLPFSFTGTGNVLSVQWSNAAFSPNTNVLAVPDKNGVTFIDLDKNELYYDPDVKVTTQAWACAYSSDGLKFAACGSNNTADAYKGVYIYDTIRTE